LIVNLAGSPGAVKDALPVLDALLGHAVVILRGEPADH
jgi:molybdopterin biosynthesis enzyme MoaB